MADRFHQRLWFSFGGQENVEAAADEVKTVPVLAGRAGQVPHLWGYRLGYSVSQTLNLKSDNEGYDMMMMLRASLEDLPNSDSGRVISSNLDRGLEKHIIDMMHQDEHVATSTSVGHNGHHNLHTWPWVPCDLIIPEVSCSYAFSNQDNANTLLRAWGVVDYSWEDVDAGKMAAILYAWGRDPQDYAIGGRLSVA